MERLSAGNAEKKLSGQSKRNRCEMNFVTYDIILLVAFAIGTAIFLILNRANLKKEGLMFLYKARWGIKFIDYVGNNYPKTLRVLGVLSIIVGYILMIVMIYFFIKILLIYLFRGDIVRAVKVPPIMPLIPYLPQAFNLNFLPPFYFTYWIIILAVIAITHEFAHGIFAVLNKIKLKSTGFGFFPFFLPVFLAAFVELDEETMKKRKILPQLSILSAGTFANVLTAILFGFVLWVFFLLAFAPSGVIFDSYASAVVPTSAIVGINGKSLINPSYDAVLNLVNNSGFSDIRVDNSEIKFIGVKRFLGENGEYIELYADSPAMKNKIGAIITKINGEGIESIEELSSVIQSMSPGDTINLTTIENETEKEYSIELESNPEEPENPWLGIAISTQKKNSMLSFISGMFTGFKDEHTYYTPKLGNLSVFIYNLLWWLILIAFSVALVNMLPVGIFDGGRFFYLTILGITKKEKIAKKSFSILTMIFLISLVGLMISWAWNVFF